MNLNFFISTNTILVFSNLYIFTSSGDIKETESPKLLELFAQDPEGSGVPQCRKCTLEFKKLDRTEQDLWKLYKDMHYREFQERFRILNSPLHRDALEDPGALTSTPEELELLPAEENLLRKYYIDLRLSEEQKQERIQSLSVKVGRIQAWQTYEHLLTQNQNEASVIKKPQKSVEQVVKIMESDLTEKERIEL